MPCPVRLEGWSARGEIDTANPRGGGCDRHDGSDRWRWRCRRRHRWTGPRRQDVGRRATGDGSTPVNAPAWPWAAFAAVAVKMLAADFYQVPTWASPAFIAVVLAIVAAASIRSNRRRTARQSAHDSEDRGPAA